MRYHQLINKLQIQTCKENIHCQYSSKLKKFTRNWSSTSFFAQLTSSFKEMFLALIKKSFLRIKKKYWWKKNYLFLVLLIKKHKTSCYVNIIKLFKIKLN